MLINVKERGIIPNSDITKTLNALFLELKDIGGKKTLNFEYGEYYINSKDCNSEFLYITNTVGDDEWQNGEIPHLNKIAFHIKNINNLTINGNGATFIIDGQVTNVVIDNCKDVTLNNFTIKVPNPDMHQVTFVKVGKFYADFIIDKESRYIKDKGTYYFVGADYKKSFTANRYARWIGRILNDNLDNVKRSAHPFMHSVKIKEKSNGVFRAYYLIPPYFNVGDRFYLYDVRRKYAGIFINNSQNVVLDGIKQHFNYSLAVVAQSSNNITIKNCDFTPNGDRLLTSLADFVQICMCKGDIIIDNNNFEGAGDDCLNVHGIHFKITNLEGNILTVRFMHNQTHGFNPLFCGDEVEFVDPNTLLPKGNAKIIDSKLINEYEIMLKLTNTDGAILGDVIEDTTMCPNLQFSNNTLSRIITRGLLITTRGKVVIENNLFKDTTMDGIVFSDDAQNWYESGRVFDVTIKNNTFLACGGQNILIKPENKLHAGAVHCNFLICDNRFQSKKGGIFIKSANNVTIKDNVIAKPHNNFITEQNALNVTVIQ